jgi:rod shape determining protein RodA
MFSIQPSELMKISLSLIYYKIAKANKKSLIKLLEIFLLFLVPSFLVFLEPDTGSIIMYFIIMLVALFNSRIKKKYLITISIIGISMVLISTITYLYNPNIMIKIFGTSIFYRLDRIIHFKDNYQLNQALIYLGSAGLFGHKDILYIPEAHTDFIFSFLIGRYGIILGIVIILCYLLLDLLLVDKLKKNLLLKFFLSTFLFSQMQNLLMNIGLLPIMGIPLPFLSYGGTNTIISIVFLGISLNKKS